MADIDTELEEAVTGEMEDWEVDLFASPADAASPAVHSLTPPGWLRFMPPRPEDEADLFNTGEAGHEGIENDALWPLIRNRDRIAAIYFGNWQRDMSQMIVPFFGTLPRRLGRLLCDVTFEVIDVLAEAKFGRRLDRQRFGTYRWEEHIDNPRGFGVAIDPQSCRPRVTKAEDRPEDPPGRALLFFWCEGPGAIPNYILASRAYVRQQLALSMHFGPRDPQHRGYERFGNAMHTVEDFYAHSNFIELALNRLRGSGDPKTGWYAGSRQSVKDSLGRYRLTTGVFLLTDTLVSLQKLLLHHLERPPGAKPSDLGQKVIRVLVRRLLGGRVLAIYDQITEAWWRTGIPALLQAIYAATGLPDVQRAFERLVVYPLRVAIANLLRPLVDAAARRTGTEVYSVPTSSGVARIVEISHSRLAKDDPHHAYHVYAKRLAVQAVRDFWRELDRVWSAGVRPSVGLDGTAFPQLIQRYMSHPLAVGIWWRSILGGVGAAVPTRGWPVPPAVRRRRVRPRVPLQRRWPQPAPTAVPSVRRRRMRTRRPLAL